MNMNDLQEHPVMIKDLKDIKNLLGAVQNFLQASDIAKSQLNLFDPIRYSPLTQEVGAVVERVNGLIGDALMTMLDEEEEGEENDGEEGVE